MGGKSAASSPDETRRMFRGADLGGEREREEAPGPLVSGVGCKGVSVI